MGLYTQSVRNLPRFLAPTDRILKPHFVPPKFSAEFTVIGPWNLPYSAHTARASVRCTLACMPPPWKPCKGGQGVPAPVGAKGTFSRFSESDVPSIQCQRQPAWMGADRRW
jgi:hypothetical protein